MRPMNNKEHTIKQKSGLWILAGFAIVVILGVFLSGCAPSEEKQKEAEALVTEAEALVEDGYYADALKKFEEARTADPGNAKIYTGMAGIYTLKNRVTDAREVLEVGGKESREPSTVYVDLGQLEMREENAELAISYCRSAVRSDGENYEAQYCLAEAYVENGEFGKAEGELDIPEEAGEWYVRAKILQAVLAWDDTETANEAIDQALKADVEDTELEETADAVRQNLRDYGKIDDEDMTDEYRDVALAYGALVGEYEDLVIGKLEQYVEDNPEYWDLFLYLGQAYYLDGDMEKAARYLTESTSLNPSDPYGAWYLARVSAETGQDTDAESMYRRAVGLAPEEDRVEIQEEYAEYLLGTGQYAEAADQLEELEESAEDENVYRYKLMRVSSLITRELYSEAAAILDAMTEGDEEGYLVSGNLAGEYLWARAEIEYSEGNREDALSTVDQAIEQNPVEPKYHLLRGQLLFELGRSEDAQKALERAVDLDLDGDVSAEAMKVLDRI